MIFYAGITADLQGLTVIDLDSVIEMDIAVDQEVHQVSLEARKVELRLITSLLSGLVILFELFILMEFFDHVKLDFNCEQSSYHCTIYIYIGIYMGHGHFKLDPT